MKKIIEKRHFIIIGVVFLFAIGVLLVGGQNKAVFSGDGVLDMFIPQYQSLKNEHAFFAQKHNIAAIGSTNRDFFYSEYKYTSLLFMIFPSYIAYVLLFLEKIIIGAYGVFLLAKKLIGEKIAGCESSIWLLGLAYGLFNVFPAYWMAVATLPWLILLIIRISEKRGYIWLPLMLAYPIFSDMLHFGVFIVLLVPVYFIYKWVRYKRCPYWLLVSDILLAAGFGLTEYRYIRQLYEGHIDLIYKVEEWSDFTFDKLKETLNLLYWNYRYIPNMKAYLVIPITLILVWFVVLLTKKNNVLAKVAEGVSIIAVIAVLLCNTEYNDLLHTITASDDSITYAEYYNTDLYKKMVSDIDYKGEWMGTYGVPKGALAYNGIKTIEGYIDVPMCIGEASYQKYLDKTMGEFIVNSDGYVTASIDTNKYKECGGRYLCSAAEITNASEKGFVFVDQYSNQSVPGAGEVYLYITKSRYVDKEFKSVPFEERDVKYNLADFEDMLARADVMVSEINTYKENNADLSDEEILKAFNDGEDLRELYNEYMEFLDLIATAKTVAEVRYNSDINDDLNSEKSLNITEEYVDVYDKTLQSLREISKSPYSIIIDDELGEGSAESLTEYEDMTDEEKERQVKLESLEKEYDQAINEAYYYEYKGTVWDMDMLGEQSDDLEREDIINIYIGIQAEMAKAVGEIYLEILQLCNEEALDEGYDNYMDYAYEVHYARDFSVEDVKRFCKDVRSCSSTYGALIEQIVDEKRMNLGYEDLIKKDDRATFEMLLPYMESIDEELSVPMRHMLDNNLFNLNPSDTKADVGYTTGMPAFGDAYIFDSPYGNYNDLYTYVHEYGHYNHVFHADENELEGRAVMDVNEIHSQGLEALMAPLYSDIYGEEIGEFLEMDEIEQMVGAIEDACKIAEFEIYAHEHPNSTVEELGKYFLELSEDYGESYNSYITEVYDWIYIPHLFNSPGYYISYSTSAVSALELYCLSYENRNLAIEKYMELTSLGSSWKYAEANRFVGLGDVFKKGTTKNMYRDLYFIFRNKR
ncbi:MAG: hypothetical protein KBS96_02135 [Lachnospiraceae bacterium]|nr:hypothetical protein [Candidatus Colinaster scatohippi]